MKLIVCKDYAEMSAKAAELLAAQINEKPDCVLGLATGSTPEGMYAELVKMNKDGKVDFSKVTSVNLDEYYPITPDNDQSYRYFMNYHLFDKVNIDKNNTYVPDGQAEDTVAFGAAYDKHIEELGGVDLQILGIGRNGHIGFNEPANSLIAGTHCTALMPDTINANARFFASEADVPKHAMTMGIATILHSRKIVIMASGKSKHNALIEMLKGDITTQCPASILRNHSCATLYLDADSSALLAK